MFHIEFPCSIFYAALTSYNTFYKHHTISWETLSINPRREDYRVKGWQVSTTSHNCLANCNSADTSYRACRCNYLTRILLFWCDNKDSSMLILSLISFMGLSSSTTSVDDDTTVEEDGCCSITKAALLILPGTTKCGRGNWCSSRYEHDRDDDDDACIIVMFIMMTNNDKAIAEYCKSRRV